MSSPSAKSPTSTSTVNVAGSIEAAQWKETLKARQATPFDPNSPTGTYGYATIRLAAGPGIGACLCSESDDRRRARCCADYRNRSRGPGGRSRRSDCCRAYGWFRGSEWCVERSTQST